MNASRLLVAAALGLSVVTNAVLLGAFLDSSSDSKRMKAMQRVTDAEAVKLRADLHQAQLLRCLPPVSYTPPEFPIPGLEARQSKLVTPSALRGEVSGG